MVRRTSPGKEEVALLRALIQRFVRSFGLLVATETPCGHPISVSHAHALMVLLEHRRARRVATQMALGRDLGIDKSNVARLCMRMTAAGHVTQRPAPGDGRSRLVALTHDGSKLARQIERASQKRFRAIFAHIKPQHRPVLCESLVHLNAAVAALGGTKDDQ